MSDTEERSESVDLNFIQQRLAEYRAVWPTPPVSMTPGRTLTIRAPDHWRLAPAVPGSIWTPPDTRERHRLEAQSQRICVLEAEVERLRGELGAALFGMGELARKLAELQQPAPAPPNPLHRAIGVRRSPVIGLVTEREH